MWARSLLDSAFVTEPIRAGTSRGAFNKQYHWQLQVTPWNPAGKPAPNAALQLYQLDLDVSWSGAGHDQVAHFSTLRLGASHPAGAPANPPDEPSSDNPGGASGGGASP